MSNPELPIIRRAYDLLKWTSERVARFPRPHRHEIGSRLLAALHELFDVLLEAKYTRDRGPLLDRANLLVEQLRFRARLAFDLKLDDVPLETAVRLLAEVNDLRALLPKALDTLADALEHADDKVTVALAVLKLAGPLPLVPTDPTETEEYVRREVERERGPLYATGGLALTSPCRPLRSAARPSLPAALSPWRASWGGSRGSPVPRDPSPGRTVRIPRGR